MIAIGRGVGPETEPPSQIRHGGGPEASARAMLNGAALPTVAAGVLATAASAAWGGSAAAGAAVGGLLAVLAFSAGPLIMRAVTQSSPPAVMAAAVGGYLSIVVLLGLVYAVLGSFAWLSSLHVGIALAVCALAAMAGQLRAVSRLRLLAFGPDDHAEQPDDDAGQRGNSGGPHTRRD